MAHPRKQEPKRFCAFCGKALERKRFNGRLEDFSVFTRRIFCGRMCMASAMVKLDAKLAAMRKRAEKAIEKTKCAECGTKENLHIHHIDKNVANNSPENLTILCASHHLKLHWREDGRRRSFAILQSLAEFSA